MYDMIPNTVFSTMDSYTAYAMVEAGLGIAMNNAINGKGFSGNVRILPLESRCPVEIGMAWSKDASVATVKFLSILKGIFREYYDI